MLAVSMRIVKSQSKPCKDSLLSMQATVVGLCLPLLLVVELELVGLEGSVMVGKSVCCQKIQNGQPWLSCQRVASLIWPLAGFLLDAGANFSAKRSAGTGFAHTDT